jgi:putative toxin-antitoxin system antitoxin component (TIGR02293 family)
MTLDELYSIGYEVFNQEMGKFHRWLRKPNPALGGAQPRKLMETTNGRNEVHDLLVRMDHGIFA